MCVTLNTFFSWAAIYFLVSMVLVGLSCLMTVLVLHIHYKNSAGVSPGFRNYVIKPLQRLTCFHVEDKHDKNVRLSILSLYITALYQYSNLGGYGPRCKAVFALLHTRVGFSPDVLRVLRDMQDFEVMLGNNKTIYSRLHKSCT